MERVDKYYDRMRELNLINLWRALHRAYHSGYYTGAKIAQVGSQGEMRFIEVNHFANLIRHTVSLTTANRQEWDPMAVNTDFQSIEQCKLASGILDYYWTFQGFEKKLVQMLSDGILYGRSGVYSPWIGGADGDIKAEALTPDRMIVDVDRMSGDNTWHIVRCLEDTDEMIARYPTLAGKLDALENIDYDNYISDDEVSLVTEGKMEVYTLYHSVTPACPRGRQMVFCKGAWIADSDLEYSRIPVAEFMSESIKGTRIGTSLSFDLMPVQEYINGLNSAMASNQAAYAVQNVLIPEESNISVDMIAQQMRAIRYSSAGGKPEILRLLDTPAEIPKTIDMLVNTMQVLSGVNSVQRGIPDPSLKSGSALAMVQSMAVQFNGIVQGAYVDVQQTVGSNVLDALKRKAAAPRVAIISGKNKRSEMKSFVGSDIDRVERVYVKTGSPMSRTPEQKRALAEMLAQAGVKLEANQLITLVETGRIEPIYEGEGAELALIRDENEAIMRGEVPKVLAIDDHIQHLQGHKISYASVMSRANKTIVDAGLEHSQRHIDAMRTSDPDLLKSLGIQSLAAPVQAPPQMSGVGGELPADEPSQMAAGEMPIDMPTMPTNPMTGEQVPPVQ
jgi:hypothetical protein